LAISTILFTIAILWSFLVLLVSFINFIIHKIRKREIIYDGFKKYEIMICIAIFLLVVNIVSVTNKMMSMSVLYSDLTINIIISIVLAIIPIAYAIQIFRKWSRLTSGKLQKTSYIITMFMGFVMSMVIIVLEMYKI